MGTEFKLYFRKEKNWALIQKQYKISMRNKEVSSEAHTHTYVPSLEIFLTTFLRLKDSFCALLYVPFLPFK